MAACTLQVHLQVVEIYCERIRDLLARGAGACSCPGDSLAVQQDRERGTFIAGAAEAGSMQLISLQCRPLQRFLRQLVAAASQHVHAMATM